MTKISVIIATYHAENFIDKAIQSVLNQTFTEWELIVVNEFSSDDKTEEIVKSYTDPRIRFIQNTEKRLGLGLSRNEGIYIAQGKYIAFLDADDICLPGRLQVQYDFLEQNQKIGGCGSNVIYIYQDMTSHISNFPISKQECYYNLFFNSPSVPSTWMFRKSILDQYECYFSDFKTLEDFEFIMRFVRYSDFTNIKTPLIKYIRHDDTLSEKSHIIKQEIIDKAIIIKRMFEHYQISHTDREIYLFMLGQKYRQPKSLGIVKENKIFFDRIYAKVVQKNGDAPELKKHLNDHLLWNSDYYGGNMMKNLIKKILKNVVPSRLINLFKNLENIADKVQNIDNKMQNIDNKMQNIDNKVQNLMKDTTRTRINTELNFTYLAGFSGRIAEREIINTYNDAPQDHILRYKIFSNEIKKGEKVLDVSCGVGYGTAYLNDYTEASSIIGGDIDANVVEFCKRIFGKPSFVWKENVVSFQQLDIANTSAFEKGTFDKICSFETLEHVPHEVAEKAFSNLYYWLKPKGMCYCSVPNNDIYPFEKYRWSPYHFRHYTSGEFYDALKKAGFSKISIKYYTPNGELLDEITPECYGTILAICEK